MTPERWAEIDRVWHAVLARPEAERAAAVVELCGSDRELRAEVEALLANLAHASAAGFGASPGIVTESGSLVGRQLGSYTVHALLGIGGMGEVYQAHDSTLGRDVALKILPDLWRSDPDRSARFDREARVLASLNHPNIGAIYGVHDSKGLKALVLELVEGETLAERILHQGSRRGLPIEDVTAICAQIIDALEAAHERGIVHRDLKPGNIKITPDGRVKVLDFGLARAVSGGSSPALATSPTITAATRTGVLLGTAAYMSPEQARGLVVDKRTDIWAFGCVLYEMLTGTPVFRGDSVTDVLANVINGKPDWSALPADTPRALRLCVERCIQSDLRLRFHDIGDVRLAIDGIFDRPSADRDTPRPARSTTFAYAGWAAAALVALAAASGILSSGASNPHELPETRLEIVTPPTSSPSSLAISPDGRSVVFSTGAGQPLYLRRLESQEAQALKGTEDGIMPFWSPDGQSIGFFDGRVLKRIDLAGGFVRTLAPAPQARRGTWNSEGTIVFGAGSIGPLYRVSAEGGAVQPATRLLPGQTNHRWPQFLPDGRRFLLFSLGSADVRGIHRGSLNDTNVTRISDRESAYAFMAPDYILFARQGGLWARRLSSDYASTQGDLVPVAARVMLEPTASGLGALSASQTRSIAFRASPEVRAMIWLDRTGHTISNLGPGDDHYPNVWSLSPDGHIAAITQMIDGNIDVWILDTERGVRRRLTTDAGTDGNPVISQDGARIVYVADSKDDVYQIYERHSDGTGDATLIYESAENKNPTDWSPDGRYVLYESQGQDTNYDLMAIPLTGDRKPFDVAHTPFVESGGRFSPDGRWVAYSSTESGNSEVYIQSFPAPGRKVQVSIGGGSRPRWRRDGRELFYVANDSRLMATPVALGSTHVEPSPPRALFVLPTTLGYEPSRDGQRFLTEIKTSEAGPITVILNWKPPTR